MMDSNAGQFSLDSRTWGTQGAARLREGESRSSARATDWNTLMRRALLIGAPLSVGVLGIWHPIDPGTSPYQIVADSPTWWTILHLLQLPLFGLLALAVWMLVRQLPGKAALVSKIALAFFVIFYTALDSITGIASGIIAREARDLSAAEIATIEPLVNSLFLGGGPYTFIPLFAILGWGVAAGAAAVALRRAGVSRLPVLLMGLSAIFFGITHEPPFGPIGMAAMLGAVVMIEFLPHRYWRSCPVRYPRTND
jgi:hypothetical protein